jgi:peptide deformylase
MRSRSALSSGLLGSAASAVSVTTAPPVDVLPPIVQVGADVLRARAAEVPPADIATKEMQRLVATMIDVMRDAPGVGLAAPQIGVSLRLFVMEDKPDYMSRVAAAELEKRGRVPVPLKVFFNPVLRLLGDRTATFLEGCLSVDGFVAQVERSVEVEIEGLDEHGAPHAWRVSGWPARILQHETDHLEGTLYIDRMQTRSFAKVG